MKKWIILLALIGNSFVSNATLIDLSNWSSVGNGDWVVASDGKSVKQLVNGSGTYFLSEENIINKAFEGQFQVQTSFDDDFIGFVFGYNGIDDFLLFDWKQGNQKFGDTWVESGFRLGRVSGSDVNFTLFTGDDLEVLGTSHEGDNGWKDNAINDFTLDYSTSGIKIDINGENIFDVAGTFNTGKFGFYNRSQSDVVYSGVEQTQSTAVPEPASYLMFASGLFGLALRKKQKTRLITKL
jgi:hypothetical protein